MRSLYRGRLQNVIILVILLVAMGTVGYRIIEGWPLSQSLFMTVITISTVGYNEVEPLSPAGEYFSIALIILGVGSAGYSFGVLTDYIVAGELRGALRKNRMARTLARMNNHYIICGFGRVGQQVVESMRANRFEIVVIDGNEARAPDLDALGVAYLIGNATDDAVLSAAGIERASGLCMCLPSDADNVFTILSARAINSQIHIISRCNAVESEHKLRMAGADQIINPYHITGSRMAAQLLHPGAVEFLDVVMRQGELEFRIEEIVIGPNSKLEGHTLGEAHVRANTGVNVLAVRRANGKLFTNLKAEFELATGDALIGLGTVDQLATLSSLANAALRTLNVSG
jgi:voltage-gated potassium channel